MNPGGLFSKSTREGVSATESRWIKIGRHGLDQGREKEGVAGRNRSFHGGAPLSTTRSSPARGKLSPRATVCPTEATGMMRGRWRVHPGTKHSRGMARAAPAMTGSEEELAGALDTAIQATKCQGKRSGRDRRARGFSPRGKARTGKARGRRSVRR